MSVYALEEMAWVAARERADEARRTRPHTNDRPKIGQTVISVTVSQAGSC